MNGVINYGDSNHNLSERSVKILFGFWQSDSSADLIFVSFGKTIIPEIWVAKISLMNKMLSFQKDDRAKYRHLAPVIHILPGADKKRKRKALKKAEENKLPQFYTEPIFRAKLHDFL